jgi:hypothetical protein
MVRRISEEERGGGMDNTGLLSGGIGEERIQEGKKRRGEERNG